MNNFLFLDIDGEMHRASPRLSLKTFDLKTLTFKAKIETLCLSF